MRNRRQMTPGAGGHPGTGGPAVRPPPLSLRNPTDVDHGHGTCDIGRAGPTGHISS
jgi:hypothetical protein